MPLPIFSTIRPVLRPESRGVWHADQRAQVLNHTTIGELFVNETELERLLHLADGTDPGQTNAIDGYIQPFFNRGGKLLTYVGLSDDLIPPGSSIWCKGDICIF